jgi:YHS domain-containing protein
MNLVEIACPRGAMSEDERARMAASITSATVGETEMAPEATLKRARRMTHIAFRELDGWTTGDGPVAPDAPPPFVITVTVPEAWRSEVSRQFTGVMRAAIRRYDAGRGYSRAGGDVWINTVGILDGSIGLNGTASTADDVLAYMTEEYRAGSTESTGLPDGVVIDPICGMHVRLVPKAITLDHDGTTVGFCSLGCRAAYARQHGLEIPGAS